MGFFKRSKSESATEMGIVPRGAFEAKGKEKSGWLSPTYTQTKSIHLDPAVLAENRCVAVFPSGSSESDAYKVLRTRILHRTKDTGANSIMITSALPGEGKTLTSINLAFTFSKEFKQTVLLVDCDLRRQNVHRTLGIPSDKGIIDYLLDDKPVSELLIWPGVEKLTLISGGRTVLDSTELLGSPRMKELALDLKTRYPDRYVFFDVPPILVGADALAFAPLVDVILVVVHAGSTSTADVKKALDLMPKEKVLGLILNQQERLTDANQYKRYAEQGSISPI